MLDWLISFLLAICLVAAIVLLAYNVLPILFYILK
jgi:hypothetical protein